MTSHAELTNTSSRDALQFYQNYRLHPALQSVRSLASLGNAADDLVLPVNGMH